MARKFTNKTIYSKDFQKKVALLSTFNKDKIFLPILLMALTIYSGAVSLNRDAQSLNAWSLIIIGFILCPIVFFLIPYLITMTGYRNILKELNGKDFYVEAEFTNSSIRFKNSLGQIRNVLYENISDFSLTKDIVIIKDQKERQAVYLDKNTFNPSYEELNDFINKKLNENKSK